MNHIATRFNTTIMLLMASMNVIAQDRTVDMNFNGQLVSAVEELKEKMSADSDLKGRKLRLGKFSANNLPDSSFEVQFETGFRELAKDLLDENSELIISGEFDFVPGQASENKDLQVIQVVLKLVNRQRRVLQTITREINNSADIARITGTTIAPPDDKEVKKRNDEVRRAFEDPAFTVRDKSRIQAKGNAHYAVEILRSEGGTGPFEPVVPRSVNGMAFVDLSIEDTFVIVPYSFDNTCDASVSVSIDGLDVLNAFNADDIKYEGYLVPRASGNTPGSHVIPGWLRTTKTAENNVFQFVINELGKGAATARKSRSSRGVINVQFFEAVPVGQHLCSRSFGEVGTGEPLDVAYEVKEMQRRETPVVNIAIRYSNVP